MSDTPLQLPQRFGPRAFVGVGGCLGGVTLLAITALLGFSGVSSSRGMVKLTVAAGIGGIACLATTFKVTGAEFRHDGVQVWSYLFWFVGSRRFVPANEVRALALGEKDGKFTVSLKFADDAELLLPLSWASVKDAQAVIDLGTRQYGASAEVAIKNQAVLLEAASFANAQRFTVTPYKNSKADGERLPFRDADGDAAGETQLLMGWFQEKAAHICEDGDFDSAGAQWHLKRGSKIVVSRGTLPAGAVEIKSQVLHWTDPSGITWSAVFTSESEYRTPFTFKFFRGLAANVGSKSEREAVLAKQGDPQLIAIANGEAKSFTVDVADENGWPWVRIALACAWMRFRPSFSFEKR